MQFLGEDYCLWAGRLLFCIWNQFLPICGSIWWHGKVVWTAFAAWRLLLLDFPASFLFYLTFWNDYTRHSISTRLFIPKINYYDIKYCLISVLNWNHILCDWKRRFYVLDLLQSRLRNLGPSRVENRPYLDLRLRIYQLISLDFSVSSTVSNFKSLQIIVYLLLICRSVCQISSSLLFWKKFN